MAIAIVIVPMIPTLTVAVVIAVLGVATLAQPDSPCGSSPPLLDVDSDGIDDRSVYPPGVRSN